MYNYKHKYVFRLIFLTCLLGRQLLFSQDTSSYKNRIIGSWVSYYGYRQDTIVYVPFDSPFAENIGSELRYGGITFKDSNNCLYHTWKMCGNDDGPNFYPGKWNIDKLNNKYVLSMIDINQQPKRYFILEIVKDKIVLVPNQD